MPWCEGRSWRHGLLASLAVVGALGTAPARAERLAFVLNSGDASVSVIDADRLIELRRVPMLREPHHMALSPDHKYLLVGDTTANEVVFLDSRAARSGGA